MVTITKETIIGDILDIAPQTAPLFMAIGMHCLGCPASRGETVEEACMVHGIDTDELLEELNQRGEMVTFLGDGVPVFRELIAEKLQVPYSFAPAHVNKQRAAAVAALGSIYYKEGRTETAMEHVPEYLRVSQAERERAEREKAQKQAGAEA